MRIHIIPHAKAPDYADMLVESAVLTHVRESYPDGISIGELARRRFAGRSVQTETAAVERAVCVLVQARLLRVNGSRVFPGPIAKDPLPSTSLHGRSA